MDEWQERYETMERHLRARRDAALTEARKLHGDPMHMAASMVQSYKAELYSDVLATMSALRRQ